MLREVVDEYCLRRRVFLEDCLQGRPLGPLIGEDARVEPVLQQLRLAHLLPLVDEVGQDHHVGMLAQRSDALDRAGDRRLAVHFGVEKSPELLPYFFGGKDFARFLPAQRGSEIIAFHAELDPLRL